jgi:hypothetical protein
VPNADSPSAAVESAADPPEVVAALPAASVNFIGSVNNAYVKHAVKLRTRCAAARRRQAPQLCRMCAHALVQTLLHNTSLSCPSRPQPLLPRRRGHAAAVRRAHFGGGGGRGGRARGERRGRAGGGAARARAAPGGGRAPTAWSARGAHAVRVARRAAQGARARDSTRFEACSRFASAHISHLPWLCSFSFRARHVRRLLAWRAATRWTPLRSCTRRACSRPRPSRCDDTSTMQLVHIVFVSN